MLENEINDLLKYINEYNKYSFFVEAGAHDGILQSNTLILEKVFNWKGLLIEPSPSLVNKCKLNRSVPVEHAAIVGPGYTKSTVVGNFLSESAISSIDYPPEYFLDNELLIKEFQERSSSHQIEVPAYTFETILNKYNVKHIDFFSLDVEGYELDILKGIDFNKTHISLILVETANRPFYQKLVRDYLKDKNFIFVKQISGNDDLFLNTNLVTTIK